MCDCGVEEDHFCVQTLGQLGGQLSSGNHLGADFGHPAEP